jgi:pimeloyl-ACP methyl ester carboxylesterase
LTTNKSWQQQIGNQRDWVWRGWQTRYTYIRSDCNRELHPPLIFLHGFGACIEHWRKNLPILSRDRTVYALDLLGFGASRKSNTEYSVYLWVEQVYDFWRTFINEPVVLVGNSLGSLVCMTAAAIHPDMVKGIAMENLPDVFLTQENVPKRAIAIEKARALENALASPLLLKTIFRIVRQPKVIRRALGLAYENKTLIDDELIEIIAAPAEDEGSAQVFTALFKAVRKPHYAPSAKSILPNLSIPILLIWGNRDRVVSPTLAPIFAKMSDRIQLVELENVGHCPHDELPEVFNRVVLDWLQIHFSIVD